MAHVLAMSVATLLAFAAEPPPKDAPFALVGHIERVGTVYTPALNLVTDWHQLLDSHRE